jgi:hypothetical protein
MDENEPKKRHESGAEKRKKRLEKEEVERKKNRSLDSFFHPLPSTSTATIHDEQNTSFSESAAASEGNVKDMLLLLWKRWT